MTTDSAQALDEVMTYATSVFAELAPEITVKRGDRTLFLYLGDARNTAVPFEVGWLASAFADGNAKWKEWVTGSARSTLERIARQRAPQQPAQLDIEPRVVFVLEDDVDEDLKDGTWAAEPVLGGRLWALYGRDEDGNLGVMQWSDLLTNDVYQFDGSSWSVRILSFG